MYKMYIINCILFPKAYANHIDSDNQLRCVWGCNYVSVMNCVCVWMVVLRDGAILLAWIIVVILDSSSLSSYGTARLRNMF